MIKRKLSKYLMLIGAMILVIAVVVPSVAAYEGHLIDIKAHDTIPVTKEARLADAGEIAAYIPSSCNCPSPCTSTSPCTPCVYNKTGTWTAWDRIQAYKCFAWIVNMYVTNPLDYTMENVTIYDAFNENVNIKVISASPDDVTITNGNQVNLWEIDELEPGETACLTLIVWTKCECECKKVCVSSTPSSSPPLNLGCGLFNLFYGLFNQGSNCDDDDDDCEWKCVCKCKNLKQSSDGKYYLQAVHTCGPCPHCGPCPPCEPSGGILMKWDYTNEKGETVHDSYTGGPLLEITVYNH